MLALSSWLAIPAVLMIFLIGVAVFIPSDRPFRRLLALLTAWRRS